MVTPAESGRPAFTQLGSRLMASTPSTVIAPRNSAEFSAASLLCPPASMTLAAVKPSGILCRKIATKSTQPSHVDTTNPDPMATPSKNVCVANPSRSEEHTSELQSRQYLVCRLLLEKRNE